MDIEQTYQSNIQALLSGNAPDSNLCSELSCGLGFLSDFWINHYLDQYIPAGGSKLKFVTGKSGCGKTFFLRVFEEAALNRNYIVAAFSASDVWLHDFSIIYLEVLRQCDLMNILQGCANSIIRNMGYDPAEIPEGMTFIDYLSEQSGADALTRREIRLQLKKMFMDNPLLDNNFALSCTLLTGGILGHPTLEDANRDLLLGYLHGEPGIKNTLLRSLGLAPEKLSKYNARHMFRSLSEVIRLSGYSGLLITIDHLDVLLNSSGMQELHYTPSRRMDTYESIRQLIDEIDTMHNIMFVFAFDKELLHHDKYGFQCYSALMMRIQNEIISERFNCFADIADLDDLAKQKYTAPVIVEMADKLADFLEAAGEKAHRLNETDAERLIYQANYGTVGLPRLVNRSVIEGVQEGFDLDQGVDDNV